MTWITGTATDFKDLLSQVNTGATANGWTQELYTTGGALPNTDELILKGPGFGAGYEVYFGIRTSEVDVSAEFCFEAFGFTIYDSGRTIDAQINSSPSVFMRLWNAPITYWMSVSDRRILLIAKCSNTYHSLYAGFIDPFSTPVEYPYPFYLGSDSRQAGPFGAIDNTVFSVAQPADGGAYIREAGGVWRKVSVYSDGGFVLNAAATYTVWPYMSPGNNAGVDYSAPPNAKFEPQPGSTDIFPMMPCFLMALFDQGGVLGVLEGLFWVAGNALSAEQELTVGSDTYQVFIAISRSLESPNSFYAVKEA